jgi:hypothetical protein
MTDLNNPIGIKSLHPNESPFIMNPYRFAAAGGPSVGGWVELGRHTLGSTASEVFVASLPDKRYYMVLYEDKGEATAQARLLRYNSDSGSNYANRLSSNGASESTLSSQTQHNGWNANDVTPQFNVWYIANQSGKEKLLISQGVGQSTAGAGNAPTRTEYVGKSTLSAVINRIGVIQNAGVHGVGTTITVLGWDPADTHTSNFWEELASVDASGSSSTMDTGSFTAKKYLWIQAYVSGSGTGSETNLDMGLQFNSDTATNYSDRLSSNGASDGTSHTRSNLEFMHDRATAYTGGRWTNGFFINNSANEKLVIWHYMRAVSGAGTAPARSEGVGKWANTSSQITSVQGKTGGTSPNYPSGSFIKVFGSD